MSSIFVLALECLLLCNAISALESGFPGVSTDVEEFFLPPIQTQRRFSLALEEESRLGDAIFRVIPTPESGASSFSKIEIAPNCSGASYFVVSNASAGEIRLARLLDFERAHNLDLDIRAYLARPMENGIPLAPMAHALVGIEVINVNDHMPVFEQPKDPITGELYAQVSENAAPGTLVAELRATDIDQGEVGEMRYHIIGVAPGTPVGFADAFGVEPTEGAVRVVDSTLLDREKIKEIDLLVAAVDNPNRLDRQYAAISRLTISLVDENDNKPAFNDSSFDAPSSLCECAETGTVVATVTAKDADESSANQLFYRLLDANVTYAPYVPASFRHTDPRSLFQVDSRTGQVKVAAKSLASMIGNYTLLIEVVDQGGMSNRTYLHFNVTSDNQHSPEFTISKDDWTNAAVLSENVPTGTRVFRLTAADKDTFENNNQVEFFFYDKKTDSLVLGLNGFKLDKTTGEIQSARLFDAETDPSTIDLAVVAVDQGTPPKQTNGTLVVRILDEDEFSPKWAVTPSDGCNVQFTFRISENSPIGGRVGRLWSHDNDRTNRSYFRLEQRNDAKYFKVDPTTGVLSIANPTPSRTSTSEEEGEVTAPFLDFENRETRDFVLFVTVSPLANIGADVTTMDPITTVSHRGAPTGCMRGNTARVHVRVTNMEDSAPTFERVRKPYYYCVAGDAVKNTLVTHLPPMLATDQDTSDLTFRIAQTQWRSSTGFVSVSCAFKMKQPSVKMTEETYKAQMLVNSALGNYTQSYFKVPIEVRDKSGQTASTVAYVWVTPGEGSPSSHDLSLPPTSDEVVEPSPPSDDNNYYVKLTVAENYEVFMSKLSQWVDCLSERFFAGDTLFAGAPICIGHVRPSPKEPNGLTEVRIAAATRSDMLLAPAVLLANAVQSQINATGGGLCGIIDVVFHGSDGGIFLPIVNEYVAVTDSGFDPLALLIALACILLFLILLLLILLAICCRARKKAPILIPAPQAPPSVPVFAVKPARLYETQEAYMSVDSGDQFRQGGFEEQEVAIEEAVDEDAEEIFEIPLPREYETQTVLLDMPNGIDNPSLILDHGDGDPQEIPLTNQHGARHLSGSVYSEPYFRQNNVEQRAFSMLHIDTKPQPPVVPIPVTRAPPMSQPRRQSQPLPPEACTPPRSPVSAPRSAVQTLPTTPSVTGRSSRAGAATPSLPGASSHIARRLDDIPPSPSPRRSPPGLLRPAISADSITLLSEPQQARRAALQQQQEPRYYPDYGRNNNYNPRTDESEPSEADDVMRGIPRHHLPEDDDIRGPNGRLRRSRSLPKYLQPPAELQSVMAELHDYIKSPEQKARRRRISEKYRAKLVASGGAAALGNQTGQTSSSSADSLNIDRGRGGYGGGNSRGGNQGDGSVRGRDYMML